MGDNLGEGSRRGSGVGWIFIGLKPPNSMPGVKGSSRALPFPPPVPSPSPVAFRGLSSLVFPIPSISTFPSLSSSSSFICPPVNRPIFPSIIFRISSASRNFALPLLLNVLVAVLFPRPLVLLFLLSLSLVFPFLPSLTLASSVLLFLLIGSVNVPSPLPIFASRLLSLL